MTFKGDMLDVINGIQREAIKVHGDAKDGVILVMNSFLTSGSVEALYLVAQGENPTTPDELASLLATRNEGYGNKAITAIGHTGIEILLLCKIMRLESLYSKDHTKFAEQIKDTLIDICGYCILDLALEKGMLK